MASDGAAIAVVLAMATTTAAAAAPQVPMSEIQVLIVSAGFGLFGGVVATLIEAGTIQARNLFLRMLASMMMAVSMVGGYFTWTEAQTTYLSVFALSGVSGMSAWHVTLAIPKLVPVVIKEALKRASGGIGK